MFRIITLIGLMLSFIACTPTQNTVLVKYEGCDVPDKEYTSTVSMKDLRKIKPDEVPSFCSSIKVYHNGTLAYTLVKGDRLDGLDAPKAKNKASDTQ